MRAACRNCRLHHAKRNFKPFPGTRTAGASVESNTCHAYHEDGRAIQPNNPSSVHFPAVSCGLWRRLTGVAYTSWLLGVKEESEAPEPLEEFIGDAVLRKGPRIRFELQNGCLAGTHSLQRSGCNSTWSNIRPPAGFDRCSAASRDRAARHYPSYPQFPCETARYYRRLLVMT